MWDGAYILYTGVLYNYNPEFVVILCAVFQLEKTTTTNESHNFSNVSVTFVSCFETKLCALTFVTLHHEMSRNVPDGHFQVFIFSESFRNSESTFYAFYNGENHFQIRGLVAELHVFEYGGMALNTFGKTGCKC